MVAKQLYTIGYEGADIRDFVSTLLACGVTRVLDIREVPISRKRGFSKKSLQEVLEKSGIGYFHLKSLGDPKPGREAARRGDFLEFEKIYRSHLATPPAQAALIEAGNLAKERISSLLCFERDNQHCHRSIVADSLVRLLDFKIRHIGVRAGISSSGKSTNGQPSGEFALG